VQVVYFFAQKQKMLCFFLLSGKIVIMQLPRYIQEIVEQDLAEKMVFLTGPRQMGKTTLARTFLKGSNDRYFNWDRREDRKSIRAAHPGRPRNARWFWMNSTSTGSGKAG